MGQSSFLDCLAFNLLPHAQDFRGAPEVDVSWRQIAQALVIAGVIVVFDEAVHGAFEIAGQVVVFKQDAVFQGLMPALDLALRLGMGGAAHMIDAVAVEPVGEFGRHVPSSRCR